jgi:hypothetical protein
LFTVAGAVVLAALITSAVAFGPAIRWAAHRRAEALGIDLEIGKVRPGLGSVMLLGVRIQPRWAKGVALELDRVVLGLGGLMSVRRVEVRGGTARLDGPLDTLRKQWAGRRDAPVGGERTGSVMPVRVEGLTFVWSNAFGANEKQIAWGARFDRNAEGFEQVGADLFRGAAWGSGCEVRGFEAQLQRLEGRRVVSRVSARSVRGHVDLDGRLIRGLMGTSAEASEDPATVAASAAGELANDGHRGRRLRESLREAAGIAGSALLPGGRVELTGVHAELRRKEQVLNIGPARLVVGRDDQRVDVRLIPGSASAASSVTLALTLPLGDGPVEADLAGGPVSLATLGVHEGDMGLVDVRTAELEVQGRANLAADGATLGLSGRFTLNPLSLRHDRLAPDVVRGIRLGGSGAAVLALDGSRIRATDVELSVGTVRSRVSLDIERADGEASGVVEAAVPLASCQELFDSTPRALLPDLAGMQFSGHFSFEGRVGFDTRRPADADVTWKIQNACRITAVPANVHPSRFDAPWRRTVEGEGGTPVEIESGPGTASWVPFYGISSHMETAVIVCEDSRFRAHGGFDEQAIADSIKGNLRAGRFVRGASTISMQLAKNLYLSRHKTLSRKLQEAVLTLLLEQQLVKDEILELYLNVIEFGPGIYGIGQAARHYFDSRPSDLSIAQSLYLASILPNPRRSHFMADGTLSPRWAEYIHRLARIARKIRRITDEELAGALSEELRLGEPRRARFSGEGEEDEAFLEGRLPPGVGEGGSEEAEFFRGVSPTE